MACCKLDGVRFAGGHVYRAQLSGGAGGGAGDAPLSVRRSDDGEAAGEEGGPMRVRFDGDEAPAAAADDGVGISRVDKGSL